MFRRQILCNSVHRMVRLLRTGTVVGSVGSPSGDAARRGRRATLYSLLAGNLHRVLLPLTLFHSTHETFRLPLRRYYTLLNTKTSQLYKAMLKIYLTNNNIIFG